MDRKAVAHWKRTKVTVDLLRCDLCGEQADALHFLSPRGTYPDVSSDEIEDMQCVFSCPKHEASGGYMIDLTRWFEEGYEHWREHLEEKRWGRSALFAWSVREEDLLHEAAEAERHDIEAVLVP